MSDWTCWFIAMLFIGFRSAQTIYVTRPHESNLLESPKWVGLQNMFCIGISHCQCTLSVLMYWLWEGECPITGVYSFYKARQIVLEGCLHLSVDLTKRSHHDEYYIVLEASAIWLVLCVAMVTGQCSALWHVLRQWLYLAWFSNLFLDQIIRGGPRVFPWHSAGAANS